MTTIREGSQQILGRHLPTDGYGEYGMFSLICEHCRHRYPCPDRVTALAQINALNEAEQVGKGTIWPGGDFTRTHRLIPDPETT